jgi:exosortase
MDAAATVELLGWLGIPAMPHGNVIEVATGVVGIDEACSGIRSFQATRLISLFLGEFYRLNFARRLGLVLGGFALSLLFNLVRMTLLVWVAARNGVAAIASWHDPSGVTILVACFFSLWGLGVWLQSRKQKAEGKNGPSRGRSAILRSRNCPCQSRRGRFFVTTKAAAVPGRKAI